MRRSFVFSALVASALAINCSAGGKAAFVYAPPPDFSKLREHQGLKGAGVFLLHIQRATGLVTSVEIEKSTGSAFLDQLSLEAFRKWRAKPGTNPIVHVPISYGGRYPPGLSRCPSNKSLKPTPLPVALLFFMSYPRVMKPGSQRRGLAPSR